VFAFLAETLGPQVLVGDRIDQLSIHADMTRPREHAALQHITLGELLPKEITDFRRLVPALHG
jgi:hypothetical protein